MLCCEVDQFEPRSDEGHRVLQEPVGRRYVMERKCGDHSFQSVARPTGRKERRAKFHALKALKPRRDLLGSLLEDFRVHCSRD